MLGVLCSLLKDICREKECVMFRNEKCVLVTFLEEDAASTFIPELKTRFQEDTPQLKSHSNFLERAIEDNKRLFEDEIDVPEWLMKETPEQLKSDILEYVAKGYAEDDLDSSYGIPYGICELFLYDKGKIEMCRLPVQIASKVELAGALARREFKKTQKEKKEQIAEASLAHKITEIVEPFTQKPLEPKDVEKEETNELTRIIEEPDIPSWITEGSLEEIGTKILEFLDSKESPQQVMLSSNPYKLFELFWMKNGIEEFSVPADIQRKMLKAKSYVLEEIMRRESEKKKQEQVESEKEKMLEYSKIALPDSAEAIADEMVKFIRNEYPKMGLQDILSNFYELFQQFRRNKVGIGSCSEEIQNKIDKAYTLARTMINEEKNKLKEERVANEKTLLSLVTECVKWAKDKNLKKITMDEIEVFVSERNLNFLPETKKDLRVRVNVLLKSS